MLSDAKETRGVILPCLDGNACPRAGGSGAGQCTVASPGSGKVACVSAADVRAILRARELVLGEGGNRGVGGKSVISNSLIPGHLRMGFAHEEAEAFARGGRGYQAVQNRRGLGRQRQHTNGQPHRSMCRGQGRERDARLTMRPG